MLIDTRLNSEIDGVEATDENILQRVTLTEPYGYILKPAKERELHTIIEIAIYKHMIEKKLRENQQWLFTILKSIGDAVIATDINGKIKFMNSIASGLTGWREDDALGQNLKDVFDVRDEKTHNSIETSIVEALNQGITVILSNNLLIAKDEREIPIDVNAAAIVDEKEKISGLVVTFHDIIERRRIDQLKEEFVSNVSHELRTPLTTIREGISQVLDGILGETTAKQREFLSLALGDVDRLKRIINNLLDISKMEAGKFEIEAEISDIVALAKRACNIFMPQAKEKGLEIKTMFPADEMIEVHVDKDKIMQVFGNLLNNAIKFTEKGCIEVSVTDKWENIECSVSDTGRGIAKENLPKVFDKFQQFGRVAGAGEKGTGLGLSIVKGIIELHGGNILVESNLNKGTRITFTLSKCKVDRMFSRYLDNALKVAKESENILSIILVKVINFEKIRESYKKGELQEAFETIENLIKRFLRGIDIVITRFERRDMVLLLPETVKKGAEIVKGRIKEMLSSYRFGDELNPLPAIEFSYSIVSYPIDGVTEKQLMEKAESNSLITEEEKMVSKTILIVDDEPEIVNAIKRLLSQEGYGEVLGVFNGEEAIKTVTEKIPNLIILDMKLPDMSGYELIGRLKEDVRTFDIPIIILSGYSVDEDRLSGVNLKVIPIISKPFDNKNLASLVRKALGD